MLWDGKSRLSAMGKERFSTGASITAVSVAVSGPTCGFLPNRGPARSLFTITGVTMRLTRTRTFFMLFSKNLDCGRRNRDGLA
jgi:hypothetical protein